ncbi:MAG: hypothetical protein NVS2B3_13580 [Vulcanimicrobiaceae bacterium]
MGTLGGILVVVVIVLLAGLIAYLGDRVGHQVGRKRLTLFGLRPKYTSTIVAVATGMTIALAVTLVTILASGYAKQAFFHLNEINNQVNELQARADELNRQVTQVRENGIVVNRGTLLYGQFLIITPQQSRSQQLAALAAYFDAVVESVNRNYVPLGLRPYRKRAKEPEIAKLLGAVIDNPKVQGPLLRGPTLLVAIADQNLVAGDTIGFTFAPYPDVPIFHKDQSIASVEIDGGTNVVPNIAYGQLAGAVRDAAIEGGMPVYFANPFGSPSAREIAATGAAIKGGRGRFYILARATRDVFPHTGGVPVSFSLSRNPK